MRRRDAPQGALHAPRHRPWRTRLPFSPPVRTEVLRSSQAFVRRMFLPHVCAAVGLREAYMRTRCEGLGAHGRSHTRWQPREGGAAALCSPRHRPWRKRCTFTRSAMQLVRLCSHASARGFSTARVERPRTASHACVHRSCARAVRAAGVRASVRARQTPTPHAPRHRRWGKWCAPRFRRGGSTGGVESATT